MADFVFRLPKPNRTYRRAFRGDNWKMFQCWAEECGLLTLEELLQVARLGQVCGFKVELY